MGKNWVKHALLVSKIMRVAAKLQGPGAVILMYHSVLDEPQRELDTLGEISHSTKVFRAQMEALARNYDPVTIEDILLFVRGRKDLPPRPVVVSFDDGYANNHDVAAPVLNQVGVPAAFYVTVDCVEQGRLPWPARLRHAFRASKATRWDHAAGRTLPLESSEERERAYLSACEECCKLCGDEQGQVVDSIRRELDAPPFSDPDQRMMTWDQVRGLAKAGHIVGSHTSSHPNLAYVGKDDLRRELLESKRKLEQMLSSPVRHFSYPCPALAPHWNEQTFEVSAEAGYETAVTTDGGLVRQRDNPLCLQRIRPTKDVDGLVWNLEYTFAGRRL